MKLLATFIAATSARRAVIPPEQCYAKDVDIDGNTFRTNVVEDVFPVYNAADCQAHCARWQSRGCEFFVWEAQTSQCTLLTDIGHIESDIDTNTKWMGQAQGCLPCFREGWDYVQTVSKYNMNGYGYIEDVENIFKCTKICLQVGDCHHASFDTKNNRCYLKNAKGPEGVVYDSDFQTAPQHCQSNSCVLQKENYKNGYFTRYDVIGRTALAPIPSVASPQACQIICRSTKSCTNFTWQEGNNCFLVNNAGALEYSSDKISGSRDCMQR